MILEVVLAVAVIAIFVGAVAVALRNGWFSNDRPGQGAQKDELAASSRREEFTVPFRRRIRTWPLPIRVFVVVCAGLAVLFAVLSYQMVRVGASPTTYLTVESYLLIIGVVAFVAGVRARAWSDNRVGWLTVMYDKEDGGGTVERIPFMAARESIVDGSRIVQTCRDNRVIGLFWRYELVGDRRELRGKNKLPEDVVEIQLPEHAVDAPDGYAVQTSPDGDRVIPGPDNPDKTYGSPNQLSYERAQAMRRENSQIKIRNQAIEARNAELERQIDRMHQKIQNRQYQEREDFKEDIESLLLPLMGSVQTGAGQPPQPEAVPDDDEVRQNGGVDA